MQSGVCHYSALSKPSNTSLSGVFKSQCALFPSVYSLKGSSSMSTCHISWMALCYIVRGPGLVGATEWWQRGPCYNETKGLVLTVEWRFGLSKKHTQVWLNTGWRNTWTYNSLFSIPAFREARENALLETLLLNPFTLPRASHQSSNSPFSLCCTNSHRSICLHSNY